MNRASALATLAFLAAGILAAANIDGQWVAKVENRKKGAQEIVFNLKAEGDRVTGTVGAGPKGRGVAIKDGKISGDEISFTTVAKNKKGEAKTIWAGKVTGNEFKGTRQREGARRGQPFTAVKQ